ncbi:MAG: ATP-binding cassette domain-containing protein [Betaproteobacteria bacterium]|nr:ATP-binding cassette domain-containing protein [Betaproteobacteria bacterium]
MALLTIRDAGLAYGLQPLLDRADLTVGEGERIGLIGRNGTGKSSLLKVIAGQAALDDGVIERRDAVRIVLVEQEPLLPPASTLRESLVRRGALEAQDERDRWRVEVRLSGFLHRYGLDEAQSPESASGGERKRAALALALAMQPDLLLLDEPTNHLDVDGIALTEDLLLKVPASIVVTHDRAFLDRIAMRIVELDRGLLRSYPGNFAAYESRKAAELAAEASAARKFDQFWRQEEAWIRKGVEARRTRNEGRVRRLESLREQRAQRRQRIGNVRLAVDAGERSGVLVAELDRVWKAFGASTLVRDLSLRVMRGDRLALLGRNGAGKSTLLKIILGEVRPDRGQVRLGTRLQVAYFDQMREQLDPERSLAQTISPGSEWVETGSGRKHVLSYLADFLFPPQRASAPVKALSGGERNRLLLARLFAQPTNLLVLDEPTNDLDIDTLELLEATLQAYAGTLLLVSHDRAFLDNIATQTLVAEGDGVWKEYVGGYSDWVAQRAAAPPAKAAVGSARDPAPQPAPAAGCAGTPVARGGARPSRARMTFKEQRELDALPDEIEALEREQHELSGRMCAPDYHRQGVEQLKADRHRAEEIEVMLRERFERWGALDAKAQAPRTTR